MMSQYCYVRAVGDLQPGLLCWHGNPRKHNWGVVNALREGESANLMELQLRKGGRLMGWADFPVEGGYYFLARVYGGPPKEKHIEFLLSPQFAPEKPLGAIVVAPA